MTQGSAEALMLAMTGLGAVFAFMTLLAVILVCLNALTVKPEQAAAEEIERPESANDDEIEEEEIAVITAALTAALGAPPRIKRVKLGDEQDEKSAWALTGRQMVMTSHNLQKK